MRASLSSRSIATFTGGALKVIDEVQKIENWSEVVKREWDADTPDRHI